MAAYVIKGRSLDTLQKWKYVISKHCQLLDTGDGNVVMIWYLISWEGGASVQYQMYADENVN